MNEGQGRWKACELGLGSLGGVLGLGGGDGGIGGGKFAPFFQAVAFAGDVVPVEVAIDASEDGAQRALVLHGERDAARRSRGFHVVHADDSDAEGVGGPGKDAPPFVERGDLPYSGPEAGLPDAGAAAEGERADVHALNFGYGGGPVGPALNVEKHGPDVRGRRSDFNNVAEVRHEWEGARSRRTICALFLLMLILYRLEPDQ